MFIAYFHRLLKNEVSNRRFGRRTRCLHVFSNYTDAPMLRAFVGAACSNQAAARTKNDSFRDEQRVQESRDRFPSPASLLAWTSLIGPRSEGALSAPRSTFLTRPTTTLCNTPIQGVFAFPQTKEIPTDVHDTLQSENPQPEKTIAKKQHQITRCRISDPPPPAPPSGSHVTSSTPRKKNKSAYQKNKPQDQRKREPQKNRS